MELAITITIPDGLQYPAVFLSRELKYASDHVLLPDLSAKIFEAMAAPGKISLGKTTTIDANP